jgi:protein involved in polysaccharide export with SLBB domain
VGNSHLAGRKGKRGHPFPVVAWGLLMAVAASLLAGGCAQNELGRVSGFNPDAIILTNIQRTQNQIVPSEDYWIQKEVVPKEEFPGPTPADLKPPEQDYILGPGDLIDITVFELMAPGQPYATRQRISQTGQITFPYLQTVKAAGLTTRGLEEKLSDLLEPDYISNPQISVFVSEYRNLNVSVLNGVARPGLYPMAKQDMTLIELVAMAGGITQMTEDYGYVIRKYTPDEVDILMMESGKAPASEGSAPGQPAKSAAPVAPASGAVKPAATGTAPIAAPVVTGTAPIAAPAATSTAPVAPKAPERWIPPWETPPAESPKTEPAATATAPAATPTAPVAPALTPTAAALAKPAIEPAKSVAKAAPVAVAKPTATAAAAAVDKDARDILEKMAEGEMPPVQKIEAAEVAAEKKTPVPVESPEAAVSAKDQKDLSDWIWSDGKWVQVKPKLTSAAPPEKTAVAKVAPAVTGTSGELDREGDVEEGPLTMASSAASPETERLQLEAKLRRLGVVQGSGQLRRIIRFDVRALQAGDPTQNVVLRDTDVVIIPSPEVGDFYMAGEVARPGVYSLTGRKITLLQAVAASGGLTAVAVPWRTEVIRRLSETEEEIIYVDLGKIARGEVPDFYLHPEDLVRVGTDQGAIFNAVLRNAFRATYGFGSVYDMNFADFYPWSLTRKAIIGG